MSDTPPTRTHDHSARTRPDDVHVVAYDPARPDHRAAFRDLNLAWIEAHFVVEARDRYELDDPEGHILAPGGAIFMAEADGPDGAAVLGTCALLAEPDGVFELAKMAVSERARGRGVGHALGAAVVAAARERGAARLELLTNSVLVPAVTLYHALGFAQVPLPATDYSRANLKMVLEL